MLTGEETLFGEENPAASGHQGSTYSLFICQSGNFQRLTSQGIIFSLLPLTLEKHA
jgi:hypothetical protein